MNSTDLVIMAGGEGRRLAPLTNILPKPLLWVDGKTILERIVEFFRWHGLGGNVYVIVKYKSDLIRSYVKQIGLKVELVEEDEYMGTAGGLSLIGDKLSSNFFMTNCDVLVEFDVQDALRGHIEGRYDMTIMSFMKEVAVPYGIFEFDDEGDICDFIEKPNMQLWANAGVYLMGHRVFDFLKPGRKNMDELFYDMMNTGTNVRVLPLPDGGFKDIGEFQYYREVLDKIC